MFRDFLVGTFGRLLQVICVLAGGFVLLLALLNWSIWYMLGGILLLCAAYGVRYAMGYIIRHRGDIGYR